MPAQPLQIVTAASAVSRARGSDWPALCGLTTRAWSPSRRACSRRPHEMSKVAGEAGGPLLAIGIISPPEFENRRLGVRESWMRYPNVGQSFDVRFVLRTGGAPTALARALERENATYRDILGVNVAWNETRLRGPVLTLAAWLRYADDAYPSARYIAKMDDDAYLQTMEFERMLNVLHQQDPTASSHMYLGVLTWYVYIFPTHRHTRTYPHTPTPTPIHTQD